MHAEPISEQLVKENIPGDARVNTFDEWATYARSNAIVSPVVLASVIRSEHDALMLRLRRTVDLPSYWNGGARAGVFTRWVERRSYGAHRYGRLI